MVVQCAEVWREISNYLEGELDPAVRTAMEEHVRGCKHCTAVLDGTRNVIQLYGDERMLEVPLGFSQRLQRKLEQGMPRRRGTAFGWMMALAFAALLLLSFEVGNVVRPGASDVRSDMARIKNHIPADLVVVAVTNGRIFHVPGCRFIHDKDKLQTMTAGEALKEGYAPCVRCLRKYLSQNRTAGQSEAQSAQLEQEDPD
ncbi:MAG: zf-HC2 domain-containing protein [Terriglobales bacterium]